MKNKDLLHIVLCWLFCVQLNAQTVSFDSIEKLNQAAFKFARDYKYGKALSYSYIAIQHATANENDTNLASSYYTLASTYRRMQYFGKAKKYFQKSLALYQELNKTSQILLVYQVLTRMAEQEKEFKKAHGYLSTAYKLAKTSEKVEDMLVLDWGKIALLQAEKRYEDVLEFVKEVETRVKASTDSKLFFTARINYLEFVKGEAYYYLGDYENAQKFLEKHISNEYVHVNDLATSYNQLSVIYKTQGNIEKQREAELNYQENLKKKLNDDQLRLEEELQTEYSLSKDQLKLDELEEKNYQKTIIVNRFKVVLVIIILLLIGCIILGTLIIKAIYKKIKSNKLLRIKYNKLEEAKLKAEMTSKTKSNFFSMMSHELRTPLYAVTGITHLLLEESPRPSQQQYLKSLKFSGDHLLSLVNNILQANKLEDNTITIGESTFNLKANIDNIIKSFDLLIKDRENELNIAYDTEIPELLVGDSLKISQILINLISNAIKFTKNGTIRLSVEKVAETEQDVQLHFCVQDTGIGIPKEKQEKVFEMFSQNHDEVNQVYQGSGLGLSIVKRLLKLYDSEIHLESKVNVGTTFTFNIRFPKAIENVDITSEVDIDDVDFSQLKMLVVDDNTINQMLTKKILSTKQISTDIVASGAEAIEIVKNNHYDLILMDIHMPEMDGYEATSAIRKFNTKVPIIAFTAVSLDDSLPKIINSGMNDMIIKPFVAKQLFTLIQKYM
ncbi:aerobic respiration control sensor protein ArcB [Kordia sp. SMS9]|uniref:tetratricopeptide repeat-containing hybrid sensor histidine kinase/response regulator n=1 Tax=Kordia sp. SMS9 TaxID=2282170 RepID=UPI000E0D60D7|nr:ATP-binding protein [Kordia sp. SMS9]AXG70080.1 aerobic respiration control sensor protein ArcB [Kordia sp. SMS9]